MLTNLWPLNRICISSAVSGAVTGVQSSAQSSVHSIRLFVCISHFSRIRAQLCLSATLASLPIRLFAIDCSLVAIEVKGMRIHVFIA